MRQLTKLESDLVVALGFSRNNAIEAVSRYIADKNLSRAELKAIQYLINKEPFRQGQKETPTFPDKYIKALNHLNYRISIEKVD
jgi:methionine salvage enolase-phosphatase E1